MKQRPIFIVGIIAFAITCLAVGQSSSVAHAGVIFIDPCLDAEATVIANPHTGNFVGTDGDDVIVGTSGPDRIFSGDGEDIICALSGNDIIVAGDGNDYVDPGEGDDIVRSGDGNDTIALTLDGIDTGDDRVNCGDGEYDTVFGADENDTIHQNCEYSIGVPK